MPMERITRCRRCGDVIGAYEPTVVLEDGRARVTSRARAENPAELTGECYHSACYAGMHNERPPQE